MYNPNLYNNQQVYTPNDIQFGQFSYPNEASQQNVGQYATGSSNTFFTPTPIHTGDSVGYDDYDNEPPLLEELGINFNHIVQKTIAVLNPMKESERDVLEDTDLAGPLVFCLAFGSTLMLAGKLHFNYIYGLGVLACLGMWLLMTLMTPDGVAPTCVISILGYCLLPMCLLSVVGVIFTLKGILGIALTPLIVLWCSLSASKLFVTALSLQHQRFLVGYPCALVYSVFALLTVF